MNIYVGNLSYKTMDTDLRSAFEAYGLVSSAVIIKDRASGESKGFGFVEMESAQESAQAIEALDGQEFMGRRLRVNQARPREAVAR